jgi:hypothetical protein
MRISVMITPHGRQNTDSAVSFKSRESRERAAVSLSMLERICSPGIRLCFGSLRLASFARLKAMLGDVRLATSRGRDKLCENLSASPIRPSHLEETRANRLQLGEKRAKYAPVRAISHSWWQRRTLRSVDSPDLRLVLSAEIGFGATTKMGRATRNSAIADDQSGRRWSFPERAAVISVAACTGLRGH